MAKQAGDGRDRWSWTEATVWTERMLTALETGVKGGVWFSLIDKVWRLENLRAAFAKVKSNRGAPGIDHTTIEMFEQRLEQNLVRLSQTLRGGTYRPHAIRRTWIEKPGTREQRPLGIPAVRDRVVETALRNVIEPIFERDFAAHSYGFRPGRGCKDAIHRVTGLLQAGHVHVVDADLKSYFDTIPHSDLMALVREKIADGRVLQLLETLLTRDVRDADKQWAPERGVPQGAVVSPMLANLYLNPLDHSLAEQDVEMVRYADDFVILCRSREAAEQALDQVREWTARAGLTLHPDKTRLVDAREAGGFDFLGYHFEGGKRWPRDKSVQQLRDAVRAKTPRKRGYSIQCIISDVNRSLRGWFEYFKLGSYLSDYRKLDQWIRMRLRSILRRRRKRKGRGRGKDHQRWPDRYFADNGLFALLDAYLLVRQSAER